MTNLSHCHWRAITHLSEAYKQLPRFLLYLPFETWNDVIGSWHYHCHCQLLQWAIKRKTTDDIYNVCNLNAHAVF